ncbi:hypothetical protein ABI_08710 [Asticcacaulis biprosthecium C19]|uniref:Right handed beta helix domain-containing protein n=1 Tax=Asticcacaulis biprosthecium C19 TaxID=715226 RepID=F4QGA7_9CAUL|nr:right-handed parallel beta-helix repeat-containing protein [Asticcacaulis biprosthecium]EGF92435.1 hypothetical protein ABI_08710 [Asticcacaulis biprosthecium C19]
MADEQAFKVIEVVVPGPQGAGNTFAVAEGLVERPMIDRLPKFKWDLKDYPRAPGQTARNWLAAAAAAFLAFAGTAPATLALGDQTLDLGSTAIVLDVDGGALTLDVNGTTITHTGARWIEFQNAMGGGVSGKATITGPHNTSGFSIKTTDCEGMVFDGFSIDHGNSGLEFYRSTKITLRDLTFHNMYGPAFKATQDSVAVHAERCLLTNGAGFMGYADRWGNYVSMDRCTKTLDQSTLTTYLTGQLEFATTEAGEVTTTAFLGEEGFGGTVDTKGHLITNCTFEFIGDNGLSFTSTDSVARGCVFRWCKHDGGHSYNYNNRFEGCSSYDCGKVSNEYDEETGALLSSTPVTGYGIGIRPNAGGCAYGNQVIGCLAIDCRKGGFNAGNDLLYRLWVSGLADIPNTAPPGEPSNAVDNVKDYCKVDSGAWTTVWTAGGPSTGNQPKSTSGPVPTQFGTVSAAAYGITIDAETGKPTNTPEPGTGTTSGLVWWNDGRIWWYWRSSCPVGRGPWATDTVFRGCYSNHPDPERRYYQDPQIPADANNSWEIPSILSIGAKTYTAEAGFTAATLSETVAVKASGANTGNGSCVLDATTPRLAGCQIGKYQVRCTVAGVNATFTLTDPFGVLVGTYVLSGGTVTTDLQVKLAITGGATNYIVGDGFDAWILNTLPLSSGSYGKLNAAGAQTVNRVETPLGFVYHEVVIRNGNSQAWTLIHDDDHLRLPGNLDVTLGYKDWIRLLQIAQSGEQIWMAIGCSVQNLAAQSYATETTLTGAPSGVLSIGNTGLAVLNFTGNVTSVSTTVAGRQRIVLRGTTGCDVTFANSSNLRLEGVEGGNQTFRVRGRNNYIELLKLSVSGAQVWMQVGGYQTP